ncbi:hypothetical protein V6R21_13795 [Limibacter armeniacum]|uniref:hypothetical protein n=1 Tax=Limibacter armeniacum TaxID=466084 RepID=UPI002FE53649
MKKVLTTLFLMVLLVVGSKSIAQNWNSTFVQAYYGTQYDDDKILNNPVDGKMTTVTLQHASSWKYGGNFFFINYYMAPNGFMGFDSEGNLVETSNKNRLYSEWSPYLSLSKVLGQEVSFGPVADVSLEGSLNIGNDFRAGLAGIGFTFKAPQGTFLKLIGYYRNDNFYEATTQITGAWDIPIWKRAGIRFEGFIDVIPQETSDFGVDYGTDVLSQARLLVDIGRHFVFKEDNANKLELGIDWYNHFNKITETSVPQVAVRWTW